MKILKISAGVRYWEDGRVNGVQDISYEEQEQGAQPRMPFACKHEEEKRQKDKFRWDVSIDAENGVIIGWPSGTTASMCYKVCDDCEIKYEIDGTVVATNDGYWYCPDFLARVEPGYGDYIHMKINEAGVIDNWKYSLVEKWREDVKEYQK